MWWLVACGAPVDGGDDGGIEPVPTDGRASWALLVQDADGTPLADVLVDVFLGPASSARRTTGGTGWVSVSDLEPGPLGARIEGPVTVDWVFEIEAGIDYEHVLALPEAPPPVALPDPAAAVAIGDGLRLTAAPGDLVPPPFGPATDALGAVRLEVAPTPPLAGRPLGIWTIAPGGLSAPGGLPVALDVASHGPLSVWQPDLTALRWIEVGSLEAGGAPVSGDARLVSTAPVVVLERPSPD